MRQFNYFYSSHIENKHGFFTFIPHANFFHPYFGFAEIGYNYGPAPYLPAINFFHSNNISFSHKVKVFFPEIRTGVIYIDKIKYSIDSNPIDEAKISYEVKKNSHYYDFVEIKNHIAEFEVEITVKHKYSGIYHPIEVKCDYIDILLYKQRISITETQSSIKMVPYLSMHKTDYPLGYLNYNSDAIIHMRNTTLTYDFVFPIYVREYLARFNIKLTEAEVRKTLGEVLTRSVGIMTVDAYSCKYMGEFYRHLTADNDHIPLIADTWFIGSHDICKQKVQSYWYLTVYKTNLTAEDVPGALCVARKKYSGGEVRNGIWYRVYNDIVYDEKVLDYKAKNSIQPEAGMLYDYYKKFFLKENK